MMGSRVTDPSLARDKQIGNERDKEITTMKSPPYSNVAHCTCWLGRLAWKFAKSRERQERAMSERALPNLERLEKVHSP